MTTGKPKEYTRLARKSMNLMHRASLWQGPDHLLKVSSTGFSEDYRRYYYRDIQAIIVTPTTNWHGWSLFLGFICLLTLLCALLVSTDSPVGLSILVILGGLTGGLLTVNLMKGPTCICRIRTAVQTDKIEAMSRLRTAQRVIARLRETIIAAQGGFTAEDLSKIEALKTTTPKPEEPAMETVTDEELEAEALESAGMEIEEGAGAEWTENGNR